MHSEHQEQEPKVEQLREAELVRDRLEGALRAVEEEIRTFRDTLLHPGGT